MLRFSSIERLEGASLRLEGGLVRTQGKFGILRWSSSDHRVTSKQHLLYRAHILRTFVAGKPVLKFTALGTIAYLHYLFICFIRLFIYVITNDCGLPAGQGRASLEYHLTPELEVR